MKTKLVSLALLLTVGLVLADEDGYVSVPVVPTDHGTAVEQLLYARYFTLDESYTYYWRSEQPKITEGTLLVVEVDPDFAYPRQVGVPVLYVGDTPVELTNVGYPSGRIVAIVPGHVDLTTTPIYFGSTELPERVDQERGAAELQAALDLGITPFTEHAIQDAFKVGMEPTPITDGNWLYLEVSDLLLEFVPDETERAELYRLSVGG